MWDPKPTEAHVYDDGRLTLSADRVSSGPGWDASLRATTIGVPQMVDAIQSRKRVPAVDTAMFKLALSGS